MVQVDYYRSPTGQVPAKEYIDELSPCLQAEAIAKIVYCLKNARSLKEGTHLSRKGKYWILRIGSGALICRWRTQAVLEIIAGISEFPLRDENLFFELDGLKPHAEKPIVVGV